MSFCKVEEHPEFTYNITDRLCGHFASHTDIKLTDPYHRIEVELGDTCVSFSVEDLFNMLLKLAKMVEEEDE